MSLVMQRLPYPVEADRFRDRFFLERFAWRGPEILALWLAARWSGTGWSTWLVPLILLPMIVFEERLEYLYYGEHLSYTVMVNGWNIVERPGFFWHRLSVFVVSYACFVIALRILNIYLRPKEAPNLPRRRLTIVLIGIITSVFAAHLALSNAIHAQI